MDSAYFLLIMSNDSIIYRRTANASGKKTFSASRNMLEEERRAPAIMDTLLFFVTSLARKNVAKAIKNVLIEAVKAAAKGVVMPKRIIIT
ncbi:MAG: hypothetical protein ACTSVA_05760 [Candidatus Njordarchaeales archaeon]